MCSWCNDMCGIMIVIWEMLWLAFRWSYWLFFYHRKGVWPFLTIIGHSIAQLFGEIQIFNLQYLIEFSPRQFPLLKFKEMKVNAINISMSIIFLSRKVYFRQNRFSLRLFYYSSCYVYEMWGSEEKIMN